MTIHGGGRLESKDSNSLYFSWLIQVSDNNIRFVLELKF